MTILNPLINQDSKIFKQVEISKSLINHKERKTKLFLTFRCTFEEHIELFRLSK